MAPTNLLPSLRAKVQPKSVAADDMPGRSNLALARQRKTLGTELRATAYFYDGQKIVISSVMSAVGSMIVETDDVSVLDSDVSDAILGRVLCDHLLRHVAQEPPSQRDAKRTDWPAFKASRARSVRAFEQKSSRAVVQTFGPLLLEIEVAPTRTYEPHLWVKSVAAAQHDELGARVRDAIRGVELLQTAGAI